MIKAVLIWMYSQCHTAHGRGFCGRDPAAELSTFGANMQTMWTVPATDVAFPMHPPPTVSVLLKMEMLLHFPAGLSHGIGQTSYFHYSEEKLSQFLVSAIHIQTASGTWKKKPLIHLIYCKPWIQGAPCICLGSDICCKKSTDHIEELFCGPRGYTLTQMWASWTHNHIRRQLGL